ncbi:hypothetical protein [Cohnella sp. GCM10027633]|uniref:hypothetical protein n=1 Tax=unclassified Cohnella TaxID=2636738 RepID=UPI0036292009
MLVWAISMVAIGSGESRAASLPERVYYAGIWGPKYSVANLASNVRIKSGNVKLRNVVVQGNLIIDKKVGEGKVILNGVTVKGKTIVEGGGLYGVYIHNSKLGEMIVQKQSGKTRIVASGSTVIASTQVATSVILEERDLTRGGYENVRVNSTLSSGNGTTTLRGNIKSLAVESPATFIAEKNSVVDTAAILSQGVSLQGKITALNIAPGLTATVNGKSVSGKPLLNVTGTVTRGEVPYGNGVLEITKIDDMNFLANAAVDERGRFELALDDGEYLIYGFHPNDGGEMTFLRQPVTVANGSAEWSIRIPAGTIEGSVYGLDGNLLSGPYVLKLRYVGMGEPAEHYARVDNGSFSLPARDGSYEVDSVRSLVVDSDMFLIKSMVQVTGGNTRIDLRVHNFIGTLVYADGQVRQEGQVSLAWEGGQALVSTQGGNFQASLPVGTDITAARFYGNNGEVADIGQKFVLGEGQEQKSFLVQYNSLNGKLLKANGAAYPNVQVGVENTKTREQWFIPANSQGEFSRMLWAGKYNVFAIKGAHGFVEQLLDIPFEIANNKLVGIDGLRITVPEPNVHLTIVRHDGTREDGLLALQRKGSDGNDSYTLRTVDGELATSLPDGEYSFVRYDCASGDSEALNVPFEVTGGVPTIGRDSSQPYIVRLTGANVFGKLTDEQGAVIRNGHLRIIQTHNEAGDKIPVSFIVETANDLGEFEARLKPGTYRLLSVWREGIGDTNVDRVFQVSETGWHANEINIALGSPE